MAIKLGSKVKDIITGVTGYAASRTEWLYGCARIAIESVELKKEGKASGETWVDEQRVEMIEEKGLPITPTPEIPFTLGSKVKDKWTGFEGMAVARTVWATGMATVTIEPTTLNKDGKPIEAATFDIQRIELIEAGKPPVSKDNAATTGGPQDDPAWRG